MGLNVLFVAYPFPPLKYPRSIQLAHLASNINSQLNLEIIYSGDGTPSDQSLIRLVEGIKVHRVANSPMVDWVTKAKGSRIKDAILIDQHYLWSRSIRHFVLEKARNVDVVVTFGQPMSIHSIGLFLKEHLPRLKWVAHFSDPWTCNPLDEKKIIRRIWSKSLEKRVFRLADHLLYTSPESITLNKAYFKNSFPTEKSSVLNHIFNSQLFVKKTNQSNNKQDTVIRYIGSFYGERQPNTFLRAFLEAKQENVSLFKDVIIELIGPSTSELAAALRRENLLSDSIVVKPPVSYLESIDLLTSADLLLLIDAPSDISVFFPSKLVDYLASQKTILGITPQGASRRILEQFGHRTANPDDLPAIKQLLVETMTQLQAGHKAEIDSTLLASYSSSVVGPNFCRLLQEVVENKP